MGVSSSRHSFHLRTLQIGLFAFATAILLGACRRSDLNCGCECCKGKEVCCCHEADEPKPASAASAVSGHALKGVVVEVLADRNSLLVKHEEIPGVMRAMTMLFKVEAETLSRVKKGDTVTATMIRDGEDWRLRDVKPGS